MPGRRNHEQPEGRSPMRQLLTPWLMLKASRGTSLEPAAEESFRLAVHEAFKMKGHVTNHVHLLMDRPWVCPQCGKAVPSLDPKRVVIDPCIPTAPYTSTGIHEQTVVSRLFIGALVFWLGVGLALWVGFCILVGRVASLAVG
jgi:hypothetical protein